MNEPRRPDRRDWYFERAGPTTLEIWLFVVAVFSAAGFLMVVTWEGWL